MAQQTHVAEMTQQHYGVGDHWWSSPLVLDAPEVWLALRTVNSIMGTQFDSATAIHGGRSGAAVYAVGTTHSAEVLMRLTSRRRAAREKYAVMSIPSARRLWISEDGMPVVDLPEIRRNFPVAATIVRYVLGSEPADCATACQSFNDIFESSPIVTDGGCPRAITSRLTWLGLAMQTHGPFFSRSVLRIAVNQDWTLAVGHGDPNLSNLIRTETGHLVPVDFASGGIVARRVHRARWFHSVHFVESDGSRCPECEATEGDTIALLADASRRLRSDYADPARRQKWECRIHQLMEMLD